MVVSQAPSQRPLIREPESVGIDALPLLYSYPPLHGWTLHSLMFPAVVRCAACEHLGNSVLVASNATSGEVVCAACYGVSTAAGPVPTVAAVLGAEPARQAMDPV
ncbi:hypothetical protein [Kutzneria sp. 744]|jgi:hypothetical protein|uniref:hypothetical protein n=1 Tax=Kutzneria sp. (strain 744) TaxID=345341 RepID=UPI0003EED41F|nr:hypothetical protein [Kutzneria sp. 744]EWM12101.1 hypothetical protein KUTG_02405 [Kutzneria sp. 744]